MLGSGLAKSLFKDGISLGREVYARRQLYAIIGILEPAGKEFDNLYFAPACIPSQVLSDSERARMYFSKNPVALHFVIDNAEKLDETKAQLSSHFEDKYGEHATFITLPREEAERSR